MILDQAFRYITELKKQNDTMLLEGGDKVQGKWENFAYFFLGCIMHYDNLHFFLFYESEYALPYFRLPQVELWVLFLQLRRYVDCGASWRS